MAAVGSRWVSPVDFWKLHPDEFWLLCDTHAPPEEDKWAELYDLIKHTAA